MRIVFTCAVCERRSAHAMTHHAYTRGVVIIQCPGCAKHHLIADHLGWFPDAPGRTVEEMMHAKGAPVRRPGTAFTAAQAGAYIAHELGEPPQPHP